MAVALSIAPQRAWAMTFEQVGSDLFASGPIAGSDVTALQERLATGTVRRLVLVNSSGGELRAGLLMARMVLAAQLSTLASGHCYSACSLVFMAGKERAFASGHHPKATVIGIHGPSRRETRELSTAGVQLMLDFYRQRMGTRFQPEIIGPALTALEDHTGMLRVRDPGRNRPADRVPWFCPSSQVPAERCTRHPEHDALSLGVLTQALTVDITLPPSMRTLPTWFGVELTTDEALYDATELAAQLMPEPCQGQPRCRDGFEAAARRWVGAEHHRAIAVTLDGRGYAFNQGAASPRQAALAALYSCNHPAGRNARLCRLLAVDDRRVPDGLAPPSSSERQVALQNLRRSDGGSSGPEITEPANSMKALDQALAAERAGPFGEPRQSLRADAVRMPTPARLEGVEVLATDELLQRLRTEKAPLLLFDVASEGDRMIPGALHVVQGGRALADATADLALDKRFQAILRAAGASRDSLLVFYAEGPNSWWAFNAALRAVAAGYTRVIWYRGGFTAWQRAGLPTLQKTAVAVLS